MQLVVTVNATGNYANTVTITGVQNDPIPANNTSSISPTPIPIANLSLIKSVNNPTPLVGSMVVFTLSASNAGPSTATGVVLTDHLPAGYTFVSATPSIGIWSTPSWNIGSLAVGATATLQVVAMVNLTGDYTNTATIQGNETDPVLANNTNQATTAPIVPVNLSLTKTVDRTNPFKGSQITFTLRVENLGLDNASGVKVREVLPDGYTFVSASGDGSYNHETGIWTIGSLLNGSFAELRITVIIRPSGNYVNSANVSGNQFDPQPGNNTASVSPNPVDAADLAIVKTVSKQNPTVNELVTFQLAISNTGPSPAVSVVVADLLPGGYQYVSHSGPGIYNPATGLWTVGSLAAGANQNLAIVVRVLETGSYLNTATITSQTADPEAGNNSSTVTIIAPVQKPVVRNESIVLCQDTPFIGNVLSNDNNPMSGTLTVSPIVVLNPASGTLSIQADGNFTYIANPGFSGLDMAIVSVCNSSACVNDTIRIMVSRAVVANGGADIDVCDKPSVSLGGNFVPGAEVLWKQISGPVTVTLFNSNMPNAVAFGLVYGTYVFEYTLTNGACVSSDRVTVTNWEAVICCVDAGPDIAACNTTSITMNAPLLTVGVGVWSQESGPGLATIVNPGNPKTLITGLVPGLYTFKWTVSNGPACSSSCDFVDVMVSASMVANAGPDAIICETGSFQVAGATASGHKTIQWGSSGTGRFNNPGVLNPIYTPSAADIINGSALLTLTVVGDAVCPPVSDQMLLTISRLPKANAGPDAVICQRTSFRVSQATAADHLMMIWTTNGKGILTNTTTLTPSYTPAAGETGTIRLTLSLTGSTACGSPVIADDMLLTINPAVIVSAGPSITTPYNTSVELTGVASNGSGSYQYNWTPANLLLQTTGSRVSTRPLTTHTTFYLIVTDLVTGCQGSDSVKVTLSGMNLAPIARDDRDTTRFETPVIIHVLRNDTDPDGGKLTVTLCGVPANGLAVVNTNGTITYTPYAGYSGNDSFCYRICDDGNPVLCTQAMVYVFVKPKPTVDDLVIYNGFSPNGDGVNETWVIKGIEDFPDNEIKIFNRWGDKIRDFARYDNVNVRWDGTNNRGKLVPDGTYYYIIDIKGLKTFMGWVQVVSGN